MTDVMEGDGRLSANEGNWIAKASDDHLFTRGCFLAKGNEPTVGPETREGAFVLRGCF